MLNNTPQIIAHRGASTDFPENSLQAFDKAVEFGADGIELDIHLCASGEAVVIHDATIDKTTNGQGYVADYSLQELQQYNLSNGEKIPILEEVLERYAGKATFCLEIKVPEAAIPTAKLIEEFVAAKKYNFAELIVISDLYESLANIKHYNNEIITGATFREATDNLSSVIKTTGAKYILPHYSLVDNELVNKTKSLNIGIICWTVNESDIAQKMTEYGVVGIITDMVD